VSLEAQLPASELVEPFLLSEGWRPCDAMLPKIPCRFPPQRNQLATGCHSNHRNLSQYTINDIGKRHVEERYEFASLMLLRIRVGGGGYCGLNSALFWGMVAIGLSQEKKKKGYIAGGVRREEGKDATFEVKRGPIEFPNTVRYRGKVS